MKALTVRELAVAIEALARVGADEVPDFEPDHDNYIQAVEAASIKLQGMRDQRIARDLKIEERAQIRMQNRIADHIDGYDRDDLGLSEDS